jgi:hypothetical protein
MRPIKSDSSSPENTQGWHYTPKCASSAPQPIDPQKPPRQIDSRVRSQTAQVGLALTLDWAKLHQNELLADWELCASKQAPQSIAPLE